MEFLSMGLEGKTAVVTGASRGLGKMIALGLARAGAKVVLASRSLPANEELAGQIRAMGREALPVKTDVTQRGDLTVLRDRCLEFSGRIDILVNNAGVSPIYKKAEAIEEATWDEILQTDLKAVFFCSQVMGEVMRQQKSGKIINVASAAGLEGIPRLAAYAAAKAGVINITKTLALEWASYNICVNAVAPGIFEVGVGEPIMASEKLFQNWLTYVPLGRVGKKEEICGAVVFLASEAANYVTGQILAIDGGWTAGHLAGILR